LSFQTSIFNLREGIKSSQPIEIKGTKKLVKLPRKKPNP